MSVYQRALKVFSTVAIVMGAIVLAAGVIVIVAAFTVGMSPDSQAGVVDALAAQGMSGASGSQVAWEVASMGLSVALLGGYFVATGIFGRVGAKNPDLTLPAIVLSVAGLCLASLNLVGGFISGTFSLPGSGYISFISAAGNAAIMAFLMVLSMIVRAQGKLGIGMDASDVTTRRLRERQREVAAMDKQLKDLRHDPSTRDALRKARKKSSPASVDERLVEANARPEALDGESRAQASSSEGDDLDERLADLDAEISALDVKRKS